MMPEPMIASAFDQKRVHAYSGDGVEQGAAKGNEFRTSPFSHSYPACN